MNFQSYALTYPQLVLQAAQMGYEPVSLSRLRRAHETSLRMLDGFYRAQDTPFICHLIRTASIVMKHGGAEDTVLASLLHAVYMFGQFRDGKVGGITDPHRREIKDLVGPGVEGLILDYMKIQMNDPDFIKTQRHKLAELLSKERDILLIGLANELEDFLDLQMVFRRGDRYREIIDENSAPLIGLAQALGHAQLAGELEEAFKESSRTPLPDLVKFDRRHAYELTEHFHIRRGRLRLYLSKIKNSLKNFLP